MFVRRVMTDDQGRPVAVQVYHGNTGDPTTVADQADRMFRCLKALDLLARPIRQWTEERVPAHIFLCMLVYYVEWHMRQAPAPVLFEDEELARERKLRDPVLPANPSESANAPEILYLSNSDHSSGKCLDFNKLVVLRQILQFPCGGWGHREFGPPRYVLSARFWASATQNR